MPVDEKVHPANSKKARSIQSLPYRKKTPKQTLRWFCHRCVGSKLDTEVENCGGQLVYSTGKPCAFFPYRMGKRPPMKVFKQFCLECMGGSPLLVRECDKEGDCPIHTYRFGKNPNVKGAGKEQMAAIRPPETLFSTAKTAQKRF